MCLNGVKEYLFDTGLLYRGAKMHDDTITIFNYYADKETGMAGWHPQFLTMLRYKFQKDLISRNLAMKMPIRYM